MSADLRKNVTFWHFTFSHISHQNGEIFTFQVSSGQLVVVVIILKGFSESQKNWNFPRPRPCEKNDIFRHFTFLHISNPNEEILSFQLSYGQLVMVFIILKGLPESKKNEDFHNRGHAKNRHFWAFHIFGCIASKLATIYISSVLWSTNSVFKNSRKLKFFMTADLWKMSFEHFTFSHISHQNEQSFIFHVSSGQILGISHFCIFLMHISKYIHFKCLVVNKWWCSKV